MMTPEELRDDVRQGYLLWIKVQREKAVRMRQCEPQNEVEHRQRQDGLRQVWDFDCIRSWVKEER